MSKEIALPSGATVKLKDPATLLKKDRDKVLAHANDFEGVMRSVAIQDGMIAVSVIEWSFDLIPPSVRMASLGDLPPKDYVALVKAVDAVQEFLFPDFFAEEEGKEDPKAITANSND